MRPAPVIAAALGALALGGVAAWWLLVPDAEQPPPFPEARGPAMQVTGLCARMPDPATTTAEMTAQGWQPLTEEQALAFGRADTLARIIAWSADQGFDGPAEMARLDEFAGMVQADLARPDRAGWHQVFAGADGSFAHFMRDPRLPGALLCNVYLAQPSDIDDFLSWLRGWTVESTRSEWMIQEDVALRREPPGFEIGTGVKITDPALAAAALGQVPGIVARATTSWRAEPAG